MSAIDRRFEARAGRQRVQVRLEQRERDFGHGQRALHVFRQVLGAVRSLLGCGVELLVAFGPQEAGRRHQHQQGRQGCQPAHPDAAGRVQDIVPTLLDSLAVHRDLAYSL
jgi:hypothetical protein